MLIMTMDVELPATVSHYTCVVPLQGLLPRKRLPRTMSEIWIQCFSCCVTDEPPPKRRHRIDRSMIGSPTNFRHTAHVGSGDMNVHLNSLQHQMASKGGYEYAIPVNVQIPVVDVKN